MGTGVFVCQPAGPEQKIKPMGAALLRPGFSAPKEVALADHPDQTSVFVDDWKTADAPLHMMRTACQIEASGSTEVTGDVMTSLSFIAASISVAQ